MNLLTHLHSAWRFLGFALVAALFAGCKGMEDDVGGFKLVNEEGVGESDAHVVPVSSTAPQGGGQLQEPLTDSGELVLAALSSGASGLLQYSGASNSGIFNEERAISFAIANAPEILLKQAGERSSGAGILAARSAFFPALSLEAAYGQQPDRIPSNASVVEQDVGVGAYVKQQLFDWGASRAKLRSAHLREQVSRLEREASELSVVEQVRKGFVLLRQITRKQRAYTGFIKEIEGVLNEVRSAVETGSESKATLLGIESDYHSRQVDLSSFESDRLVLERSIINLIGAGTNSTIRVNDAGVDTERGVASYDVNATMAVPNRPEVKAAALMFSVLSEESRVISRGGLPRVDLTFGAAASAPSDGVKGHWDDDVGVGAVLSWSPFDGGLRRSQKEQIQIQMESAMISLRQVQSRVEMDIKKGYDDLRLSAATLKATEKERSAAREASELALSNYRAGLEPVHRAASRMGARLDAEMHYLGALTKVSMAQVSLESAAGGGVSRSIGEGAPPVIRLED